MPAISCSDKSREHSVIATIIEGSAPFVGSVMVGLRLVNLGYVVLGLVRLGK